MDDTRSYSATFSLRSSSQSSSSESERSKGSPIVSGRKARSKATSTVSSCLWVARALIKLFTAIASAMWYEQSLLRFPAQNSWSEATSSQTHLCCTLKCSTSTNLGYSGIRVVNAVTPVHIYSQKWIPCNNSSMYGLHTQSFSQCMCPAGTCNVELGVLCSVSFTKWMTADRFPGCMW